MLYLCFCVCMCIIQRAMATHSSILDWRILWTEEPGRMQSMGSVRVGHDWATSLSHFTFMHWRRKWQPTLVFLPGESQGRGSLVGCCLWVTQGWTRLKRLSSSSSGGMFFILAYYPQVFMSWLYKWGNLKCPDFLFCALNLWSLCRPAISSVGMMGVIFSPTTLFLVSSSHSACDGYPWMPQFTGLYLKD